MSITTPFTDCWCDCHKTGIAHLVPCCDGTSGEARTCTDCGTKDFEVGRCIDFKPRCLACKSKAGLTSYGSYIKDIGVKPGEVMRYCGDELLYQGLMLVVTEIHEDYLKGRLFEGADIYLPEDDYEYFEVLEDYPVPDGLLR